VTKSNIANPSRDIGNSFDLEKEALYILICEIGKMSHDSIMKIIVKRKWHGKENMV
jgi:hypothetical protein